MYDDDENLRSIPPFLRRCERPASARAPVRPARKPAAPPAPTVSQPRASVRQNSGPQVIDLAARQAAAATARQASETAPGGSPTEDMTLQVSLPRSVVRQICLLAAERDTTQRAIVLRALRLAGFSVPDGAEADRHAAQRLGQV